MRWIFRFHAACAALLDFAFTAVAGSVISILHAVATAALTLYICAGFKDTGEPPRWAWGVVGLMGLVYLILDGPYLYNTWTKFGKNEGPFAIFVARSLPRMPVAVRPLVCIWWLTHFAMAAAFAWSSHFISLAGSGTPLSHRIKYWTIALLLTAGLCSTANVFLITAVTAMTRKEQAPRKVWNKRRWIDLCVALAVCLIPARESHLPEQNFPKRPAGTRVSVPASHSDRDRR